MVPPCGAATPAAAARRARRPPHRGRAAAAATRRRARSPRHHRWPRPAQPITVTTQQSLEPATDTYDRLGGDGGEKRDHDVGPIARQDDVAAEGDDFGLVPEPRGRWRRRVDRDRLGAGPSACFGSVARWPSQQQRRLVAVAAGGGPGPGSRSRSSNTVQDGVAAVGMVVADDAGLPDPAVAALVGRRVLVGARANATTCGCAGAVARPPARRGSTSSRPRRAPCVRRRAGSTELGDGLGSRLSAAARCR